MGPYNRQKSKYCMIIATMTFIIGKYRTFSNMQVDWDYTFPCRLFYKKKLFMMTFYLFQPNPYQLTFHLPLHRYLACFMVQGIQTQGLHLKDIPLSEKMLKTLLIHPLQIQVTPQYTSEIMLIHLLPIQVNSPQIYFSRRKC
jgi:hypothetical protein